MNVTCDNCKTKLTIPDHKVPQNRESVLKCPKCKEQIKIGAVKPEQHSHDHSSENKLNDLALICIGATNLQKKTTSSVKDMGLNAVNVFTTKEALKKLEYHIYPLVIIDDTFDNNRGIQGILEKLNSVDMSLRRKICLVFISSKLSTNDYMAALHISVNNIINTDDIAHIEIFLSNYLTEHKNLYTIYNASLDIEWQT